MLEYVAKRLLLTIPTVVTITLVVFLMLHAVPGDPAIIFAGDKNVTPEQLAVVRLEMGLDRPIMVQYIDYLSRIFVLNLGRSLYSRIPVTHEIGNRVSSSAELAVAAFALASVLGILLGVVSALWRSSWVDVAAMSFAIVGVSMPIFWLASMLIFVFAIMLGWFPVTGAGGLNRLVLPALALGMISSATLARLVRSSVLEILSQPYVTTARSKGLREMVILTRHVLKNAFIPVITVMGLQFGTLLSGAVITETVFARPGLGKLLVDAILIKDFPVIQAVILIVSLIYVLMNLLVDVSYAFLDPRIRFD
jgi:peptide/nickel transport system permease protein/oligopeptide transport system permease protein